MLDWTQAVWPQSPHICQGFWVTGDRSSTQISYTKRAYTTTPWKESEGSFSLRQLRLGTLPSGLYLWSPGVSISPSGWFLLQGRIQGYQLFLSWHQPSFTVKRRLLPPCSNLKKENKQERIWLARLGHMPSPWTSHCGQEGEVPGSFSLG